MLLQPTSPPRRKPQRLPLDNGRRRIPATERSFYESWQTSSALALKISQDSNPLSLVRLARLHGTGQLLRETLLASDEWQAAAQRLGRWSERPELELNA